MSDGEGRLVTYHPLPRPHFAEDFDFLGMFGGRRRWRDPDTGRIYEYDSQHSEFEVYNKRGRHLGVADVATGETIKPAKKDRRIRDV